MPYKILTYEQIDREEWSRLVASSATGTWFQTPEAYDFLASMPELFQPFVIGVASPQPSPAGKGAMSALGTFASVWGAHTADSTQYSILKENAQGNRKNPTEDESILWAMLKGNNLGLHFRRQHIILDYIVDFICLEKGLVIELDGGYHNNLEQAEYDKQRTTHLQKLGYTELRFTNEELLTNPDAVIARIREVAFSLPSLQGRAGDRLVLRAVCCGYVTKERSALKQFFTRRAIIIGGPALVDDCTDEEVEALMIAVKNLPSLQGGDEGRLPSPIYIETRNFNDYSRWKNAFAAAGFNYQPHLNYHVDTSSVEVVESNLGKSRKRDIRTTVREGVTIADLSNERVSELERERMVHEYYLILKNLYETKVKTPLFPESFFQTLAKHPDARFLLTELNGKIVGGTVCVAQEGKCLYEWFACGEDGVYPHVFPSCYATYAGIRYAAEHGMPRFDMMGAGKPDEAYGVRDFKAKFGGLEVEHGRFLCITKPLLYKIGTLGVKILKKLK